MKRQTIFVPHAAKPLNSKDIAIIRGLAKYRYLLPEQVMRRYWHGKSLSRAHAVLKHLTDQGYARTVIVPRSETRGRPRWAYGLGAKGLALLRAEGDDIPRRLHLSRQPSQQLPQTLFCNDVSIAAHLLSRDQPAVRLTDFLHEQDLHIAPNHLIYPDGRKRDIEFDGVLFFDIADAEGEFEQVLCLETDMGTSQRYWREKLDAYIDYVDRHYRADYRTDSFSLIVATPAGETHLRNLLRWTERVLCARSLEHSDWPRRLYFSALSAATTPPVDYFLAPTWQQPFADARAAPLEVHLG